MNIIEKINNNRSLIVSELYEWSETFDNEVDDEGEKTLERYNFVFDLAERLENNVCTEKDYQDIVFHIDQINYNEVRIKMFNFFPERKDD